VLIGPRECAHVLACCYSTAVSGDFAPQTLQRARPVSELALDALLERPDELARRWAVTLVLARPLAEIGEVPLEAFARDAPALCAQAVRALQSDAELERLLAPASGGEHAGSPPAAKLGELAGAEEAGALVRVTEALRGILWEELLSVLRWPAFDRVPPRLLADLGDRLAHVCASALEVALAWQEEAAERARVVPAADADARPAGERDDPERGRPVLVDERAEVAPFAAPVRGTREPESLRAEAPVRTGSGAVPPPPGDSGSAPAGKAPHRQPRALPWEMPLRAERRPAPETPGANAAGARAETLIVGLAPGEDQAMRVARLPTSRADESA